MNNNIRMFKLDEHINFLKLYERVSSNEKTKKSFKVCSYVKRKLIVVVI